MYKIYISNINVLNRTDVQTHYKLEYPKTMKSCPNKVLKYTFPLIPKKPKILPVNL